MSEGKQMQADLLAELERQLAAANARAEDAKQKCEQYWNGPAVGEAELHAILEYIHKTLRGDFDASLRSEAKREGDEHDTD